MEFSNKGWKLRSIDSLLKRSPASRNQATMHRSTHEIPCETGIPILSVYRIIHRDLQLICFKRRRAQLLSEASHVAHKLANKCAKMFVNGQF